MQLYDYVLSGSCYKVRLFLSVIGQDYEKVPVDYHPGGEHKTPTFLQINPLGQIPVLVDDDLILRDAQAILVYLAGKYDANRSWYPEDPRHRARSRCGCLSLATNREFMRRARPICCFTISISTRSAPPRMQHFVSWTII